MLEVQKYLSIPGNTLETLIKEFSLNTCVHSELPLIILNYDTIESKPRNHPIVQECRALTLNVNDFSLVSRSFKRFWNWGEYQEEMNLFDWRGCEAQSKEDGSLFKLFNFQGQWIVSTRGSFATDKLQFCPYTWRDIFEQAIGRKVEEIDLDPELTYVFELVSPFNKIVRLYKEPAVYLLSIFKGLDELTSGECNDIVRKAKNYKILRPKTYRFNNIEEIKDYLYELSKEDATFEGIVVRNKGQRWKVKSLTYLALHQMRGEGDNLWNPKYQLDFMLNGEEGELLATFPEVTDNYRQNMQIVQQAYENLVKVWRENWNISGRKEFAQTILPLTKFASILFTIRDRYGDNQTEEILEKEWRSSKQLILKNLFKTWKPPSELTHFPYPSESCPLIFVPKLLENQTVLS